jgi:hypothetical protein
MAWGTDTAVYRDPAELSAGLAERLRSGAQVVKQDRGSSGNGVWRVELIGGAAPLDGSSVRVQGAQRGALAEDMTLAGFVARSTPYFQAFSGTGSFVVQPYAGRLGYGMVRCYIVQDRVAGFGHQFVTALMPAKPGESAPDPPPRYYFGPEKPEFQRLRRVLESEWLLEMQRLLSIETNSLPVIWDADFLMGERDAAGEDTYILCEVNVSGVFPIPDESIRPLAEATLKRIQANRTAAQR